MKSSTKKISEDISAAIYKVIAAKVTGKKLKKISKNRRRR